MCSILLAWRPSPEEAPLTYDLGSALEEYVRNAARLDCTRSFCAALRSADLPRAQRVKDMVCAFVLSGGMAMQESKKKQEFNRCNFTTHLLDDIVVRAVLCLQSVYWR